MHLQAGEKTFLLNFPLFFPEPLISMMILLLNFPLLFPLLLFSLFMVSKLWKRYKYNKCKQGRFVVSKETPPGPWKLPLIGNLHQILMSSCEPHRALTNLAKKHGPIMHLQVGEVSTIVITSKEAAEMVFKTHDLALAQRPEDVAMEVATYKVSGFAFSFYGNYWKQIRKLCTTHFLSLERVSSYRSIREDEASKCIKSLSGSEGHVVNLSSKILVLTSNVVSRALFGDIMKDRDEFLLLVRELMREWGGANSLAPVIFPSLRFVQRWSGVRRALDNKHRRMDEILERLLKEREKAAIKGEEEDLLDVLLRLYESKTIKAIILDMLVGGSQSPSSVVEWAMAEMLRNPRVMEKAQSEVRHTFNRKSKIEEQALQQLNYLKAIIKETLRLHPLVPFMPRESTKRFTLDGFEIPFKAKVIVNTWGIHRDSKNWNDPDCFIPERFVDSSIAFQGSRNCEYIPFGGGSRACPGISFALSTVELSLAHLLYHYDWTLPNGIKPEELDMGESISVLSGRQNPLFIIPKSS